ncbi:hypothetical protein [Bifidobacterium tibiigranuli]|jgi:hypothetical protein|uniref:hypothetical protein n=1 Tax=Bifidobacterium tibiigranuli TaxID=2172043 RepID=UPI0026EFBE37|nr:hypothetical protein [Bifidobacterium tibiigranuli]MCI1649305.1 hypothetical protein [Bifidobacterium tibiigranuli]MCI2184635.1 hypothetical protein [Bifidobacterium tibiigranuli]MCI2204792.1 hypothetical protein [Bifidobacterium tibiigranuli]
MGIAFYLRFNITIFEGSNFYVTTINTAWRNTQDPLRNPLPNSLRNPPRNPLSNDRKPSEPATQRKAKSLFPAPFLIARSGQSALRKTTVT